jgi:hypothetical protein
MQRDLNETIVVRIRSMRTLWLALIMSIVIYFGMSVFVMKPATSPNNTLSLILVVVGMFTTLSSVLVKQKIVSRAIEQQSDVMVQQAYVVAWAMCEVSALLGLVDYFVTGNRFYYVGFMIALIGDLINFPRRQDVEDALFNTPRS